MLHYLDLMSEQERYAILGSRERDNLPNYLHRRDPRQRDAILYRNLQQ